VVSIVDDDDDAYEDNDDDEKLPSRLKLSVVIIIPGVYFVYLDFCSNSYCTGQMLSAVIINIDTSMNNNLIIFNYNCL